MRDHVGEENIVIFGLTAAQVNERRAHGYDPREVIGQSRELGQALDAIASGVFSPDDPGRYRDLVQGIYDHDWFMVAADFDSYSAAQRRVDGIWHDQALWASRSEEHTSEIQSLMRISYAVFCLKKKNE